MRPPPDLFLSSSSLVGKLKKPLYGLKQASRQWLVTGDDDIEIQSLKSLHNKFQIKDLGHIHYFLSIKFNIVANGMVINQQKYVNEIISAYSMQEQSITTTPLSLKLHLLPLMEEPLPDVTMYSQLIGKLNFLLHTRLDLAYSVRYLSQFSQTPCQAHYNDGMHVLRYLKGTITQWLFFNKNPSFNIEAFYDSDWASCPITRRSVSGFFIFGDTPISWKSKKQVTISLSYAEAEYRSRRRVCAELAWLSRLLSELQVDNITPIPLKCDNQAAICIPRKNKTY
ncbi:uncharacterized mitochondrial protein AtMg00810-like [Lactuca sativa]|uniref:uncharacterized mitochondrial protein AtMg00810-like n=1 Tax=Lactuca sativa TaxID=4236 RepID=UPI000CD8F9BA|nr:uncharacterized mitochondrial protein AtMg00810-like [Lactuca sativa]